MLDDDQERINNLRAISNMPTEKEKPTSVFGIDTGGYENTLSPQENVVVNQLGKKLYGDKFDPSDISKDQWQAITVRRGATSSGHDVRPPPAGGPSEEEANPLGLADAQANQFLQMTEKMNPLTSGATAPGTQAQTNATAEQMIGASSTSPISQWLNEQSQAASSSMPCPVSSGRRGSSPDPGQPTRSNRAEAVGNSRSGGDAVGSVLAASVLVGSGRYLQAAGQLQLHQPDWEERPARTVLCRAELGHQLLRSLQHCPNSSVPGPGRNDQCLSRSHSRHEQSRTQS